MIKRKFEELGIVLTEEQWNQVQEQLSRGEDDFRLDINDEQLLDAGFHPDEEGTFQLTLDLTDEAERLEKLEARLPSIVEKLIPQFIEEWGAQKLQEIAADTPTILREEQQERESFQSILRSTWGEALDKLEVFLSLVTSAGHHIASDYIPSKLDEPDYVLQVLLSLHARACQIGKEVHALLSAGLADGAHARWRSLHEVAVVANFIREHGQEIAERYLLHGLIESKKAAYQHTNFAARINEPPPSKEELIQLDQMYQSLLERFGEPFATPYGWAATAFESHTPNFADLERAVGLDHFRPYYKLASHNVHANPKGILFRLGSPPNVEWLLAGPSIYGLADPGQGTTVSLLQITTWLLTYQLTIDSLIKLNVLMELQHEIGDAFYHAHWSLENTHNLDENKKKEHPVS
jgi:hypothetical protein